MACLDENEILAFFAPTRAKHVAERVDAHTADCPACRKLLGEYARLNASPGRDATLRIDAAPQRGSDHPDVDLVQRLAHAQVQKRIGTVVKGKWQVEELLGAGGMAFVFAARHRNGRRVAIKFMRPELALERSLVERFLREGYVANKIGHPGAVAILDDDVLEDGTPFLVMEYLAGTTLRQRIATSPLPLPEALEAIAQVLDVLAVAHERNVVHRDLKPDNLFRTDDGTLKVLDFGIARMRDELRPVYDTRSGMTMGTIGYMPPEQARGLSAEIDARTDVWALGATLYSLLTGKTLHEAPTTSEALLLAMTMPVEPMARLLPHVPTSVQAVLDRALGFDKGARYPSARAMSAAVKAVRAEVGGKTPAGSAAPQRAPRSSNRVRVVAGAAALVVLASSAVALARWSQQRERRFMEKPPAIASTPTSTPTQTGEPRSEGIASPSTALAPVPALAPSTSPAHPAEPAASPRPRPVGARASTPNASAKPPMPAVVPSSDPHAAPPAEPLDPLGPRR